MVYHSLEMHNRQPRSLSTISPNQSFLRFKEIQCLLEDEKCDAFMLILGIDSRFNGGAYECANYLFLNLFKNAHNELPPRKEDSELVEDIMLCVKRNEIQVYCNAVNYNFLLPYLCCLPNMRIFCASSHEMRDQNAFENYKMIVFERMFADCKRIAISFRNIHATLKKPFDKLMIEDWPIVQSFAYDVQRECSREFFTLSREIIDVSPRLHQLMTRMDPINVKSLLVKAVLTFTGTMESVYRLLDSYVESPNSELKVNPVEPLMGIYQLCKPETGKLPEALLPPYLLLGSDSNKRNIQSEELSQKTTLPNKLVESMHSVVRGYSQTYGLVCERTNFLSKPNELYGSRDANSQAFSCLTRIYTHLLRTIQELVSAIKATAAQSLDKLVSKAQESLFYGLRSEKYDSLEIKFTHPWKNPADAAHIVIVSGAVYDIKDDNGSTLGSVVYADTLLVSTLRVNKELISRNVINLTSSVPPVCNWLVTPTPIDITNHLLSNRPTLFNETMDLIITNSEEYHTVPAKFILSEKEVYIYGQRLGLSYIRPDVVRHFKQNTVDNSNLLEFVLTDGSATSASMSLPIELALLPTSIQRMKESMRLDSGLSFEAEEARKAIWVILKPKTKAKKMFLENVAPQWRSSKILQRTEYAPIHEAASAAQRANLLAEDRQLAGYGLGNLDAILNHSLSQLMTEQPSVETWIKINHSYLNHLEACWDLDGDLTGVASCEAFLEKCGIRLSESKGQAEDILAEKVNSLLNYGEKPVLNDWLVEGNTTGQITHREGSPTDESRSKPLVLTVLCGTIGSRKEAVGASMVRLVQERTRWIEIKPPSLKDLPNALLSALQERDKLLTALSEEAITLHGLVICPGNSGAKDLVDALMRLKTDRPGESTMDSIKIGCVATCVDVRTALLDSNRMPFPGLLELLTEGWTNYLIYTGPSKSQQVAATKLGVPLQDIEKFLQTVNPRLTPLYAPDGHVDHASLIEALTDGTAFEQPAMQKARLLSYARLNSPINEPIMHTVTVRFSRPVERGRFVTALKSLFTDLKPWPFYGNVYSVSGQLEFIGEQGKLFNIFHITLAGVSRISQTHSGEKATGNKPYWLTALIAAPRHGDKQYEERLSAQFMDWLRQTGQQQEQPKLPLKRTDLTEVDLDKIHDKYHLHPLPPGWYYTGDHYVSMSGERSYKHPSFDEFVSEYLQGENTKIAARNARLASHPVPDLFGDC